MRYQYSNIIKDLVSRRHESTAGPQQHCRNKQTVISLAFFILAAFIQPHALANTSEQNFQQVTPGMFVRYGLHLEISGKTVASIANTGFIVGEESVAIIDPGGSSLAITQMLSAIRSHTELPVSHVIVTHLHPDHSLGLYHFLSPEDPANTSNGLVAAARPKLVGHTKLWNALLNNRDFFVQNFIASDDPLLELLSSETFLPESPVEGIAQTSTIDLGNRKLKLNAHPKAHTETDLSIFDVNTGVLWAGDLLVAERLPSLDGSLPGWVNALEELEILKPALVIPGHGASGSWNYIIKPQLQYLQQLLEQTRGAIAKGTSLREYLAAEWPKSAKSHWQLFETQHRMNKSRAYTELEWE